MTERIMRSQMDAYVDRMKEVRELFAPPIEDIKDADDYSRLLIKNFQRIGELAGENRVTIEQVLMPLLDEKKDLLDEEIGELEKFNEILSGYDAEGDVDVHFADLISERLDAEEAKRFLSSDGASQDLEKRIPELEKRIDLTYRRMLYSFHGSKEETIKLYENGVADYEEMFHYLDPAIFTTLSDKAKKTVIISGREGATLHCMEYPRRMVEAIKKYEALLQNPIYKEQLPDYDWEKNEFMTCVYVAELALSDREDPNDGCYDDAFSFACKMEEIWKRDPQKYGEVYGFEFVESLCLLAAYRVDDASFFPRLEEVYDLYEKRDVTDFSHAGKQNNLNLAVTLFLMINCAREKDESLVSERMTDLQVRIPNDMMSYFFHATKGKMFASFLIDFVDLVHLYQEIPGGMKASELLMRVLLVLHPPTYVHSNMVAKLSLCLARHLFALKPEAFLDFPGCGSVEKVKENRGKILEYCYNAALYHDIGKLCIIDVIAMYGRKLLDSEFAILREHPDDGVELAELYPALREYVDVIRGHHIWYDGSHGYPADFKTAESPYKTIIDIVMAADCLDAATDSVGRSYNHGKTMEDYLKELEEGAGTRYAPWLPELFHNPETNADVRYLLSDGRAKLYRDTFRILSEMNAKG